MSKYQIEYQYCHFVTVEITDPKTALFCMKEMVEFWSNWESRLQDNDGDIKITWLKQLGAFILRNGEIPKDEEGWYPLDGTKGIKITYFDYFQPDQDEIEIVPITK